MEEHGPSKKNFTLKKMVFPQKKLSLKNPDKG